jgi:hypothetical protein
VNAKLIHPQAATVAIMMSADHTHGSQSIGASQPASPDGLNFYTTLVGERGRTVMATASFRYSSIISEKARSVIAAIFTGFPGNSILVFASMDFASPRAFALATHSSISEPYSAKSSQRILE